MAWLIQFIDCRCHGNGSHQASVSLRTAYSRSLWYAILPPIFTYKGVLSISMTSCCMTVTVHVVLSFFVWPSGSLWGVVTPVYSQLQPGSQLLTDHMTTQLNYQRPWDHSLTGSCSIQSNITGIHPGLVTVPYTVDVGVTWAWLVIPPISIYSFI